MQCNPNPGIRSKISPVEFKILILEIHPTGSLKTVREKGVRRKNAISKTSEIQNVEFRTQDCVGSSFVRRSVIVPVHATNDSGFCKDLLI